MIPRSISIVLAGLLGASGVGAAAASSHAGAQLLGPYALMALTHAPALLALGLLARSRLFDIAAIVMGIGAILFCADLAARHFLGTGLFPFAAPLGGFALMAGWALVTLGGINLHRS